MTEDDFKAKTNNTLSYIDKIKRIGAIDDYIIAFETKGRYSAVYTRPERPKFHLVIIVLQGTVEMIINGVSYTFHKNSYINLPVWSEIYSIEADSSFRAMATATNNVVIEDIFRNRNPFPPDFRFRMDHNLGGDIMSDADIKTFKKDIGVLIDALNNKDHYFARELSYAYFYILLTDMADMMWRMYGKNGPSHSMEIDRAASIMKNFVDLLARNITTHTDVDFYARQLCISKQYLSAVVKEKTHSSVGKVIASMRTEVAARLLRDPELTIQQVAQKLSFSDQSAFGKFFKKQYGMSPLKYRKSLKKTLLTMRREDLLLQKGIY